MEPRPLELSVDALVKAAANLTEAICDVDYACFRLVDDEHLQLCTDFSRAELETRVAEAIARLASELYDFEGETSESLFSQLDAANLQPAELAGASAGNFVEVVWRIAQRRLDCVRRAISAHAPGVLDWFKPESLLHGPARELFREYAEPIAIAMQYKQQIDRNLTLHHLAKELQRVSGRRSDAQKRILQGDKLLRSSGTDPTGGGPKQPGGKGRGSAENKIIAALSKHHKYKDRGCMNFDPIGANKLAKAADVSGGSVSKFWGRQFENSAGARDGKYSDYLRACHTKCIANMLTVWNGEMPIRMLLTNDPADDD